jgi:hypothetical protein
MFADQYGEYDLGLCICCEEAAAVAHDHALGGGVCAGCSECLRDAQDALCDVAGIGGWEDIARETKPYTPGDGYTGEG